MQSTMQYFHKPKNQKPKFGYQNYICEVHKWGVDHCGRGQDVCTTTRRVDDTEWKAASSSTQTLSSSDRSMIRAIVLGKRACFPPHLVCSTWRHKKCKKVFDNCLQELEEWIADCRSSFSLHEMIMYQGEQKPQRLFVNG